MEKIERREAKGKKEDHIYTVLFAAGTALLMVCLKMCLVEQWRAWVFLTLNLLLLGILFTSVRSSSGENQESDDNVAVQTETKKRGEQCGWSKVAEECHDCCNSQKSIRRSHERERVEDEAELPQLSKEELNERVEAFIAMFRQHLVLDAKNGSSHLFSSI